MTEQPAPFLLLIIIQLVYTVGAAHEFIDLAGHGQ
jgi:hypothetical protein